MGKPTGFMDYKRQELALRPPQERIKDWEEIKTSSLPHKEELQKQAARCMDCGIPFCHSGVMLGKALSGCPLHNLMPEFNDFVYQGLDHFAYARLNKTNNFPEFTSHVCPAPCEGACSASLAGSAGSIRNLDHVNQVMLAGAQIATIPTNVLEQMLLHPLTDKGLEKFLQDYKNSL